MLKKFSKRERAEIDVMLEEAADAVELIVADGVDAAMNRVNCHGDVSSGWTALRRRT